MFINESDTIIVLFDYTMQENYSPCVSQVRSIYFVITEGSELQADLDNIYNWRPWRKVLRRGLQLSIKEETLLCIKGFKIRFQVGAEVIRISLYNIKSCPHDVFIWWKATGNHRWFTFPRNLHVIDLLQGRTPIIITYNRYQNESPSS